MLEELNIHNFALIDRITVKFGPGLNILTGETGAGKSILIGALGMLLGHKIDSGVIRTGAEESLVSGILHITHNREALNWLEERGISCEEGTVILRRMIKRQGRGTCYIQSAPVTRPELEAFGSLLFDMHGQHDSQSLLDDRNHRRLLDSYAEIEEDVKEFGRYFLQLTSLRETYSRIIISEKEQSRQIEMLGYAMEEIRKAELVPGEEEQLVKELNILANHEKLFRYVEEVYGAISEGRGGGALSQLRAARDAMDEVVQIDPSLSGLANQLQDAFFEVEDFKDNIRQYKGQVSFDPQKIQIIEDRLSMIHDLQKKYGSTIEEILDYADQCERELEVIENSEQDKQQLKEQIAGLEQEIRSRGTVLSEKRNTAAEILQIKVEDELRKLGMPKVRFKVSVEGRKNSDGRLVYSQFGADAIEFLISPNQGEPFKKMKKIVSGGEISRIMLSLKAILAKADSIDTLIFDEIDAGIGGEVAIAVGGTLRELAEIKQILCITHLATIAARGNTHIKIKKEIKDNRTLTNADTIKGDKLVEEISRMLSGDYRNSVSLKHAGELLKKYGP